MDFKRMRLVPIYWGEWWLPAQGNAYNWTDVNQRMAVVVTGRYMDGLNQYGIGRGAIDRAYVHQIDPPDQGFTDYNVQWLFKMAIDNGLIFDPLDFDLSTDQPFYCLIVKPGIEHLRDATPDGSVAQGTPDTGTGGYHFGFSYDYGDSRGTWTGQACWIKSAPDLDGTVQRWVHEMAEAYSVGAGEIADRCQGNNPVVVDGVLVPQYWSAMDNDCRPLSDLMLKEGLPVGKGAVEHEVTSQLGQSVVRTKEEGPPHIGHGP
jgi:hypothetical protein